jgi:hypothetical protein
VKKQQVLTEEQRAFMEMPQDKINDMVERFMIEKRAKIASGEIPEDKPRGIRPLIGPHGRPRKHFTKIIAMIQNGDILTRANRGRPAKNEVRIRVEVPHNFVVMRPPVTYYFNKDSNLVKK